MSKTAVIFSGQGAQYAGMGLDLYENYSECKDIFDHAEEIAGFPLKSVCFDKEGGRVNNTRYCQAAIFTVSAAVLRLLEQRGFKADLTAGLSLGEYTSLYYSGAITFEAAVQILCHRGAYMADACDITDGVMSAVLGISEEHAGIVCEKSRALSEPVNVSNINTVGQIVISGHRAAVERAEALAKEYGGKRSIRLPVSGAYHSQFMIPAAERLAEYLNGIVFNEMKVPVISNVDAGIIAGKDHIAPTLVRQVCSAVRWADCVRKMSELGAEVFVELGPGKALSGFVKKILPEAAVFNAEDSASVKEVLGGLGL